MAGRSAARNVRVSASAAGLGSFRADHGAGARPRAGPARRRRQAVDQRPGELHPRRQFHPRRGARAAQHFRRRRVQRLRDRVGRRRRNGSRRMGRERRAAVRPLAGGHQAVRAQSSRSRLGPFAHARSLLQTLRDGVAVRGISLRAAAAPFAALRPPEGGGRRLRRKARVGARQLVRGKRRRRRGSLHL